MEKKRTVRNTSGIRVFEYFLRFYSNIFLPERFTTPLLDEIGARIRGRRNGVAGIRLEQNGFAERREIIHGPTGPARGRTRDRTRQNGRFR